VLLAAVLVAGCSGGDGGPAVLAVTTPPASATAGPAGTAPPGSAAVPTGTVAPTGAVAPPSSPLGAYQGLAAQWQRARSAFFTAISSGRPVPLAQQRTLAGTFLAAQRRFATRLRAAGWPAAARPAVQQLVARNRGQQAPLAAMAAAGSKGELTARLADYGVGAGTENAAVAAVATALS
jgi:hypothetical protein